MVNRILIVEDNKEDMEVLKKKLSSEHYELVAAEDGNTAMDLLQKESFDLVILDILLPDIDGFEICRRIRKNEQYVNLPVLFHTTVHTTNEKLIGLQMGAADFLVKDADERELLVRIRNLLNTKKALDEIVKLSVIDPITQLYNRLYFQHRLNDEIARSRRYERDFCFAIVDIDNFKKINELLGYVCADRLLKRLTSAIRSHVRSADVLCRWGGDEFGWLLPETPLDEAYIAVERLRNFVQTADIAKEGHNSVLTVSCGVSFFDLKRGDTEDVLLAHAEAALNKAKQNGANQTRVYGKEPLH
ncbi:MAG: diguanylate cyclase [Candidatus Omnitrophica bacterium]|nr:diguanylate cyclase [Candidatus Omnitrophota bacterium]MBU4479376.1 diguanylate cyclase [Candidatus Omnitrophota bacterium]MCG2703242.1 diguanylate cyclase [Candidatus Omnitrophota bacterium]